MPRLIRPPVMVIRRHYSMFRFRRWRYQVVLVGPTHITNGRADDPRCEKVGYAYWHWSAVLKARWAEKVLLAANDCRVMR